MRYFDSLNLFAQQAVELYIEHIPMGCLADLFIGTDIGDEVNYKSLDLGNHQLSGGKFSLNPMITS